jgi:hypothetical protein
VERHCQGKSAALASLKLLEDDVDTPTYGPNIPIEQEIEAVGDGDRQQRRQPDLLTSMCLKYKLHHRHRHRCAQR